MEPLGYVKTDKNSFYWSDYYKKNANLNDPQDEILTIKYLMDYMISTEHPLAFAYLIYAQLYALLNKNMFTEKAIIKIKQQIEELKVVNFHNGN